MTLQAASRDHPPPLKDVRCLIQPREQKKRPKPLFSMIYRLPWSSVVDQHLEWETRLASSVRPIEIYGVYFIPETGMDSILELF